MTGDSDTQLTGGTVDSSGVATQANATTNPAVQGESTPATAGESQARTYTQRDFDAFRSQYDRQIAELQGHLQSVNQQMLQQQDVAFEARAQAEGLTGDELQAARERYLAKREVTNLKAQQQQVMQMADTLGKQAMIQHIAQTYGVPADELKDARTPTEMFERSVKYLSRARKNEGRNAKVDTGGGSTGSVDISKLSPGAKLRLGVQRAISSG